MRARFDSDAPYLMHPHAAQIYYSALNECPGCPPVSVRNVEPVRRNTARYDHADWVRMYGPRDVSGKARS